MTDRTATAHAAADGLANLKNRPGLPVLLGFDGFVDSIIDVVDKRRSADDYDTIATIADFGRRVSDAAGKSSNFELVTKLRKLGGNGPIMANAMAAAGLGVTYIGCVGKAAVDPVFEQFTQRAEVHSLADPGYTDALEFHDGKLMLGKYDHVAGLGADDLDRAVGAETFRQLVERSALLGMINWVMMPGSETIWRKLIDDVLPRVSPTVNGKPRRIFIDLCDPAKRTDEDLKRALGLITEMGTHAGVIFGMNLSEADHVCRILGHEPPDDIGEHIQDTAAIIREKLAVTAAVIHPRQGAAAALRSAAGGSTPAGSTGRSCSSRSCPPVRATTSTPASASACSPSCPSSRRYASAPRRAASTCETPAAPSSPSSSTSAANCPRPRGDERASAARAIGA